MASYVAKKALDGKSMVVINAERAVISGTKERVVARAKLKLKTRTLGNLEKSPTHPRKPDGYVRRVIRECYLGKKQEAKTPSIESRSTSGPLANIRIVQRPE